MTGSAPLRWTFHAESNSIEGEESEERGWLGIRGSREGWRIFVLVLAGLIFAVIYSVLGTQTRK